MKGLIGRRGGERACLRMRGADARTVLQGIVSNDVGRLAPGRAIYAALLSPQGKYLFDFLLVEDQGGDLLIDVAAERAAALAKRISMYALRRDARLALDPATGVALVWSDDGDMPDDLGPLPAGVLAVADPRARRLGWRLYGPDPEAGLAALGAVPGSREDYDALRVAEAVPESGAELVPDETFILEAGFERLNGVDFRKGCYVGQEVTARMKHKTELRKGLIRVGLEGAAASGTPIITAEGKPAGTLFTRSGDRALAHLRFDRAQEELTAGAARVVPERPAG